MCADAHVRMYGVYVSKIYIICIYNYLHIYIGCLHTINMYILYTYSFTNSSK